MLIYLTPIFLYKNIFLYNIMLIYLIPIFLYKIFFYHNDNDKLVN